MALPGAPLGTDREDRVTGKLFDHIPRLHELLPNGGWPGVVYAQVLLSNAKHALDRTEAPARLRPISGATYYTIQGPRGYAQMALVGCGKPIAAASPDSGRRLFFTDGEVEELTGLPVRHYPIWLRPLAKPLGAPRQPTTEPTLPTAAVPLDPPVRESLVAAPRKRKTRKKPGPMSIAEREAMADRMRHARAGKKAKLLAETTLTPDEGGTAA